MIRVSTLAFALILQSTIVCAQKPESTEAQQLFETARLLLLQQRPAEACPLLEQSLGLATAVGTLLNLGLCHHQLGKLSSAYQYYMAAQSLASTAGDTERLALARTQASTLQPLIGSLTISVIEHSDSLEIAIDGEPYPRENWGLPQSLDSGEHLVEARADGRLPLQLPVATRDGVNRVLTLPVLERVVVSQELPAPIPTVHPVAIQAEPRFGTQRTAALVAAGAGVAALGVAVIFTVLAASADRASDPHCSSLDVCYPRGESLRAEAHDHASRANVLTIAGGIGLAGSVVLWLTSPVERTKPAARSHVTGTF